MLGTVYLVGAGPGDPGLLTLRGAECLRSADVVLYDYLASPELLVGLRPDVELVCLGKHGRGRLLSQTEINDRMIREALRGRAVVRLKGGDPSIFARLNEELAALQAAAVPYEIVPGVTAAQASASHAGIPLTNRDEASCVAFVTGQESADKLSGTELDYAALAQFPGTIVFYMGVTTAPEWSRALVAHGKSPQTPVAIVRHCTLSDQQTIFTTLAEVADHLGHGKLRPPAIVIVGEVAAAPSAVNWFTLRPLFGRTVLVTRPERQIESMAAKLRQLGAGTLMQPAIEISEPRDWKPVDDAIARLADFNWLVFSSSNGVHYFLRRLLALGGDLRALGGLYLAAIGPATVEALAEYHLTADVDPESYRAEALADALAPHAVRNRFLLARASRGREVLAEMITAAGGEITQVVVYESNEVAQPSDDVLAALQAGRISWTTVTSSAIARALVGMFGEALRKTKLAAISPLTAEVLTNLGHPPAVVAESYTTDGIIIAILAAEKKYRPGKL
ncbi:MAG TPA: uroporphyrinogen-III C-methyltransferase [Lacipirellulaceae bacterium]